MKMADVDWKPEGRRRYDGKKKKGRKGEKKWKKGERSEIVEKGEKKKVKNVTKKENNKINNAIDDGHSRG